jgi:AraC-like DNA-binding protein
MRYPNAFVLEAHSHDFSQLLHASSGVMIVETARGSWVVPPQRAVWLPARASHRVTMRGEVAMHTVYFDAATAARVVLADTCVVQVSALLRELLVYCAMRGKLDVENDAHEERLCGLLLDLIDRVETIPLALPMPRDPRALRVAHAVKTEPGSDLETSVLARQAGASARTIERLFTTETGMTFGRWRQQARLLAALALLADGAPVTRVAVEVGYASASAFIAMFKGTLGTTPSQFFGS